MLRNLFVLNAQSNLKRCPLAKEHASQVVQTDPPACEEGQIVIEKALAAHLEAVSWHACIRVACSFAEPP